MESRATATIGGAIGGRYDAATKRQQALSESETGRTLPQQAPLVVTGDLELLDGILAAAAAAGVEPSVTAEPATIRPTWASAPMVIVGLDQARRLSELVLPRRTEVYVVGAEGSQQQLSKWSAPIGAAVVALPSGASLLTAAIADLAAHPGDGGTTVAVVGGSGGVGVSTLAAGLCYVATTSDVSSMLIDLDRFGGGIDLLIGAEGAPGWRWPRLGDARGHLGDLTGHLPRVAGIDVLSTSRDVDPDVTEPGGDAVRAVLMSASRTHRLTVTDLPRALSTSGREVLRRVDHTLLMVKADVRGIAAAQQLASQLRLASSDPRLVIRVPRSGGVDAGMVSDAVGLPLAGVVGEDSSLRPGAERGEPPGRSAKRPIAKTARRLLGDLLVPAGTT